MATILALRLTLVLSLLPLPPLLPLTIRFCAKGSLYGLLHSPGCYLSWVQVVAMLLDAARGMEHLHANSVLHRSVPLRRGTATQCLCNSCRRPHVPSH